MGNMSYCRFENTAADLTDCVNSIENGEIIDLNIYEISGLKDLQILSKCIVELSDEIEQGIYKSEYKIKNEN
tara:strand:- start:643 stop:858 length:216 start_codon:yes stop_codon:yes gene_type:complete